MIRYDGLETVIRPFARSTVAIGTFDGIHLGHQAIIRTAIRDAHTHQRPSVVFTFDRHPSELLAPDRAPDYLTTPQQRNRYMEELGIDALVVATFDRALADLSPDNFVERILVGALGASTIVVGENFVFGRNRSGDVRFLEVARQRFGYALIALKPVVVGDAPASSTRVRELLRAGTLTEAEQVLGHDYWLAGTVVEGRRLGRQLGYPTANLALQHRQVVPRDGIYAVHARIDDGPLLQGACSIGNRPTIPGAGHSIETHLLDFHEDIYGRDMEVRFVQRLRAEEKFDSLDALRLQIAQDVEQARAALAQSG